LEEGQGFPSLDELEKASGKSPHGEFMRTSLTLYKLEVSRLRAKCLVDAIQQMAVVGETGSVHRSVV